jgi:hypothetical protein
MTKLAKRLTKAFSNGIVLGVVFYLLGAVAKTIVTALPAVTDIAAFAIGLGGAVGIALSEDVDEA